MSILEQSPTAKPSWPSLIRLNLGMTMLGAGAGLSYPFAVNLLSGGHGAQSLSVIALACTVPLTGAGILLAASSRKGLAKNSLDLFGKV